MTRKQNLNPIRDQSRMEDYNSIDIEGNRQKVFK